MALDSDTTWRDLVLQDVSNLATKTMVIKTTSVVFNGSLCSHDTDQGEIKPFDGTQADRLVGWHMGDSVTGASGTTPRPRATIKPGGFIVRNLTVAALANTAADYGAEVYATNDGTYTIDDPGSGIIVGRVVADEDRDSGKANVYMRNFFEIVT